MLKDAYRFLLPLAAIALLLALAGLRLAALPFALLALFVAYFFRNPDRIIPSAPGLIVSPADGRVVRIGSAEPDEGPPGSVVVGIFLNIFNVHVNRSPIGGHIRDLTYRRGRFRAAYEDAASRVNEQNVLTLEGEGARLVMRQIAGLVARRVVCWKKPGDEVARGERIGLIRFGSRVDLVLPATVRLRVRLGDRVRAGSSIIGDMA